MTWLAGSSIDFPSNLGIFDGILVGIASQVGLCKIGSLVSFVKYSRFKKSKYGSCCGISMVCDGSKDYEINNRS
jgi:hypothetical protein